MVCSKPGAILTCKEHLQVSGDISGCHDLGKCYWHPVGGGQGSCSTSPSAQDSSQQQRITQPKCQQC